MTAVTTIWPLPALVISSGMSVTPSQIGATISRRDTQSYHGCFVCRSQRLGRERETLTPARDAASNLRAPLCRQRWRNGTRPPHGRKSPKPMTMLEDRPRRPRRFRRRDHSQAGSDSWRRSSTGVKRCGLARFVPVNKPSVPARICLSKTIGQGVRQVRCGALHPYRRSGLGPPEL